MGPPRVAIVTGGGRGIGAATARRLARDGMAVAVLELDEDGAAGTVSAITAGGGTALGVGADVSRTEDVRRAVARAAEVLGPPTVLVNNAGVLRDELVFRMSDEDFDTVVAVHLRGTFLMSREVQRHQVQARWGRIVSLSSTSALGHRGQANYAAAKAGVQGLTRTLAIELGPFGVTANAIAPGVIDTDLVRATAERVGTPYEELLAQAAAQVPVGRVGKPDDVAAVASFLCSEEAGYVSGQVIYVAGGPRG